MWKADLHNHLGTSGSNPGFSETINLVYKKLGENSMFGIANSNDHRFESFVDQGRGSYNRQFLEQGSIVYVPSRKVLVVKCQEVFSEEGHILAIGLPYNKNIKSTHAKDVIKESKDLGAILCAVHPFYYKGIGKFIQENIDLLPEFSTIEAYNASAQFSLPPILPANANKRAASFYSENIGLFKNYFNLPIGVCAFTDGHSVKSIGKYYTELDLKENSDLRFVERLDASLRSIHNPKSLKINESNVGDSVLHAFKMVLVKLGLMKD
jgi:hypothetical protein